MSSTLISVQMRVGTKACAPADLLEKLDVEAIRAHVKSMFSDYTVIPTEGGFHGEPEKSAIVELFFVADETTHAHSIYDWCSKVHGLAGKLLRELAQRSIITFVTVSSQGREIRWSKVTGFDGDLQDPPFPWITLVVRHIVGSQNLSLDVLCSIVKEHFDSLGIQGNRGKCFNDLPAVGFRAPTVHRLLLTKGIEGVKWEEWDHQIVVGSDSRAGTQPTDWEYSAQSGAFLSLFQKVGPNPAYFVTNLARIRSQAAFHPVAVAMCPYSVGIGCGEGYYLDTLETWLGAEQVKAKTLGALKEKRKLETLDRLPFPLLGISVVTITPEDKVLIRRRSSTVGAYPGALHVVPSAMVEPFYGHGPPSIILTFLREIDEEMFQAPEVDQSFQALLAKDHVKNLQGSLEFLGYALDLMHGDVNVLLAFRPSEQWWSAYEGVIRLNWEYIDAKPDYRFLPDLISDAERNPSDFVPAAAVALNFLKSGDGQG